MEGPSHGAIGPGGARNPYEINFPSILSRPGFLLHGRLDRSRTLHRPSSSAHSFLHSLRHLLQHDDLLLDQSIYLSWIHRRTRQAAILGPYPADKELLVT